MMSESRERSLVWLLVPFFFGVLGGVLAYLAFRDDDKRLAERCMYLGLGISAIWMLVLGIGIVAGLHWDGSVLYEEPVWE